MKRFISFSGGVESSTMCLLFGANAKAIFADTGWEHKIMYERIAKVEKEVKKLHPNFEIIRVKAKVKSQQHKKYFTNLKDYIEDFKYYPSPMMRYCTRIFKIEPIDKFLEDQGDCELMIGLNADEGDKRTGNYGLNENVDYTYPLFENGINRLSCKKILQKRNLLPSLPVYMQRGGCVGCFFKSAKEFKAMAVLNPKEFNEVKEVEAAIQDKRGNFFSIRDGIPSMRYLEDDIKNSLFEPAEMYPENYEGRDTPCGVFCHR